MPKVNGKEFSYSPEGIAAAKAEASAMGKEIDYSPGGSYDAGGRVQKYYGGGVVPPGMGMPSPGIPSPQQNLEQPLNNLVNQVNPIANPTGQAIPPISLYGKGGKVKK